MRLNGSDLTLMPRPTESSGLAWGTLPSNAMSISGCQHHLRGREKTYKSQAASRLLPHLAPQLHHLLTQQLSTIPCTATPKHQYLHTLISQISTLNHSPYAIPHGFISPHTLCVTCSQAKESPPHQASCRINYMACKHSDCQSKSWRKQGEYGL